MSTTLCVRVHVCVCNVWLCVCYVRRGVVGMWVCLCVYACNVKLISYCRMSSESLRNAAVIFIVHFVCVFAYCLSESSSI